MFADDNDEEGYDGAASDGSSDDLDDAEYYEQEVGSKPDRG